MPSGIKSEVRSYQMYINGEWVNSACKRTSAILDPSTEEVIAQVQSGNVEDVNRRWPRRGPLLTPAHGLRPRRRSAAGCCSATPPCRCSSCAASADSHARDHGRLHPRRHGRHLRIQAPGGHRWAYEALVTELLSSLVLAVLVVRSWHATRTGAPMARGMAGGT